MKQKINLVQEITKPEDVETPEDGNFVSGVHYKLGPKQFHIRLDFEEDLYGEGFQMTADEYKEFLSKRFCNKELANPVIFQEEDGSLCVTMDLVD